MTWLSYVQAVGGRRRALPIEDDGRPSSRATQHTHQHPRRRGQRRRSTRHIDSIPRCACGGGGVPCVADRLTGLTFLSCMRMFIIPMKFPPWRAARVEDLAMNSSYSDACLRLSRHITTCSCLPGSCFSTSCGCPWDNVGRAAMQRTRRGTGKQPALRKVGERSIIHPATAGRWVYALWRHA